MEPESMLGTHDLDAVMHAAAEAYARKDHGLTERLLRQALALQEQSVGGAHPEVAKTLNNLAIICELNDKPGDAESCYRRALEIASACLPSDDPLVTTTRENIDEFYRATEFATERTPTIATSPPPPASPPPRTQPRPAAPQSAAPPPAPRPAPPPSLGDLPLRPAATAPPKAPHAIAARERSRAPAITAVVATLLIVLAAAWYVIGSKPAANRTTSVQPVSPGSSSPVSSPVAPEPSREPEPEAASVAATPAPPAEPEPAAAPEIPAPTPPAVDRPPASAATTPTSSGAVVSAELCRNLITSGAWTCTPAAGTLPPGIVIFYTRVASTGDTTIEHRWYREDRLQQSVPLRIRANPSGFRTYSRTNVTPDRAGSWKVELRTQDGTLLDEKTFVVGQ